MIIFHLIISEVIKIYLLNIKACIKNIKIKLLVIG